ncbi:4-hydroxythreonine-4-phosphate dehydrogenase PdxA [Stenoxybacter acetivorans]|uniref:4-hydroxythreonine-4-phosphate dehydrogenase PdxA n=1 Tax=Stenoxybacter acetivorans TaxID=422441 RepID=UPI0006918E4E|nr:4-hydroxythreonine-4-phosphate dehydrogenase PdxA [Stenoxybacter acetivorans]
MASVQCIAVTAGEPAGIGPDICLDLANETDLPTVVLADKHLLQSRARQLGKSIVFRDYQHDGLPEKTETGVLTVLHIPVAQTVHAGCLNTVNAPYVLALLDRAYAGVVSGEFAAMVTAPIHKGIINDSGVPFSGHTEYLAAKSRTPQVVMMLSGGGLRVALASTHLPLRDVADKITPDLLVSVLRIVRRDLRQKFGLAEPRVLVAGLNPHAGEQGHLGREEIEVIEPAIARMQQEGMAVRGPFPADTLFQPFMLKHADAVLAMYHDQGLPVLKYASFGRGVNITLGLPFIRTSVDHGTALDLAGSGRADSGSLKEAVRCAREMIEQGLKIKNAELDSKT